MSTATFINSPEDMQWLRETHLACAPQFETAHFKSAVIHGNEDCPEMIDLYLSNEPVVCDRPFRLMLDNDSGNYLPSQYYTKATQEMRLQASLQNGSPNAVPLDEPDSKPGADEVFGDSN